MLTQQQEIDVQATPVFRELVNCPTKGKVLEGGSRSSKTWSISQYAIITHLERPGYIGTIGRAKNTWLKDSVLKTFQKVAASFELDYRYNKSEQIYSINGGEIAFRGFDDSQRLHGREQNWFWMNEAMECGQDDFDQLEMRTSDFWILDYNPSATEHWIFDAVLKRPDVTLMHSTVLSNPFAPDAIVKKILSYDPTNPVNVANGTADLAMWNIYGLGIRADIKGLIFPKVNYVDEMPSQPKWRTYGIDFGFSNDPATIIDICFAHGEIYMDELTYETGLTNVENANKPEQDNIERHLIRHGITKSDEIIADSAEPKSIRDLRNNGWNVHPARKGVDSIRHGIATMNRYPLNITKRSGNFAKEQRNYKWAEDADGKLLQKPIDAWNHCWDASRYVIQKKLGRPIGRW